MQFESWAAFWNMGGYGFYVWLSFGLTCVFMVGLVVQTRLQANALRKFAQQNEKRKARIKQAQSAKMEAKV